MDDTCEVGVNDRRPVTVATGTPPQTTDAASDGYTLDSEGESRLRQGLEGELSESRINEIVNMYRRQTPLGGLNAFDQATDINLRTVVNAAQVTLYNYCIGAACHEAFKPGECKHTHSELMREKNMLMESWICPRMQSSN